MTATASGGGVVAQGSTSTGDRLAEAHARLVADPSFQWRFEAPQPDPEPPSWLAWLGRLIEAIAPALQWVFYVALPIIVGAILWFVARELLRTRFPHLFRRKPKADAPEWRPEPAQARALLADADALAAQGRYAEAAHLLLLRSVADIEGRDARLIRPSLTSRDIAHLAALPGAARTAFGVIAAVVEHGLFAGRPVNAAGWSECRAAYERFAFPGAWTGAPA